MRFFIRPRFDRSDRRSPLGAVTRAPTASEWPPPSAHDVGEWLGIGVANLVNVFNTRTVIFGGTLREVFLGSVPQIRSRINRTTLTALRENLRLRVGELGDDVVLLSSGIRPGHRPDIAERRS
ncbi:hypothetical protein [Streptomyces fagopyri]|uniref:hypothetical protein n=1 Tax=Streptomyces fagopyri TaxID=2662397 RepID=UPI00382EA6A8